jgi:hypothetical protein
MGEPAPRLVAAARPARRQNRALVATPLRLDEQVRERRVRAVRVRWREHDLAVARQLDVALDAGVVHDRDTTDFRHVVGNDRDIESRLDLSVTAIERDAIGRE